MAPATSGARTVLGEMIDVVVPDLQEPDVVALFVSPGSVREISGLFTPEGTQPRVLGRKDRSHHQHFRQAAFLEGSDQHSTDAWIDRESRQGTSDFGQGPSAVHRTKFIERRPPLLDHATRGSFEERE